MISNSKKGTSRLSNSKLFEYVWMFMFGVGGSHGNYVNKLGYK